MSVKVFFFIIYYYTSFIVATLIQLDYNENKWKCILETITKRKTFKAFLCIIKMINFMYLRVITSHIVLL